MHHIDRLARVIDSDSVAFRARLRFCPSCGLPNLKRHDRTHDSVGKPVQGLEFWCDVCGFSFNVRPSVEWNLALRLFKEHRSLRNNHKFIEKQFSPDVVAAWKVIHEKPTAATTWPVRAFWNLGDKLREALSRASG